MPGDDHPREQDGATGARRKPSLPAETLLFVRVFGLGYLVFQAYWVVVRRPPVVEGSLLGTFGLLGGGLGVVVALAAAGMIRPVRPMMRLKIMAAAIVGSGAGAVLSLVIYPLFLGPWGGASMSAAWAAVFALAVRPGWPVWATRACLGAGALFGVIVAWLYPVDFVLLPPGAFDYEQYGLSHAFVVPMLLGGTLACWKIVSPHLEQSQLAD